MTNPPDVVSALRDVVAPGVVVVDPDITSGHEVDWTRRFSGRSIAVVRPTNADEVARVLRVCSERGVSVVPQGGNTGLVGGGVPRALAGSDRPTIVLSTRGLQSVDAPDIGSMQVSLGAGVTLTDWQSAARRVGLDTPVDFAARDSATIGGAIATNAGGSRVVRFGTMRSQVVGIEAVLADGSTVGSMGGLPKETAGLHWPSVLAGSEGTFAVVTRARLRLVPWFRRTTTAMVALRSVDAAVDLLVSLRSALTNLDAVEVIQPAALDLVIGHLATTSPVEVPADGSVLVVECADHHDPSDELLGVLDAADGIVDSAVATGGHDRTRLLEVRDRITESIAAASATIGRPTFKLDVAVPVDRLGDLLVVAGRAAADDGCRLIPFGHLAEGNLHLNHLGANDTDRIAETVLHAVAEMGGTISAEHGIGIAKARYLELIRSQPDLAAQRAIKAALDPTGIMNPGVLGR